MRLYKPTFTNRWEILELESESLKHLGGGNIVADYKPGVGYCGRCYYNQFYTTEEAARAYINKEPVQDEQIYIF